MKFEIYKPENAPEKSKPLLEGINKNYGFVPNLMGVLAESTPVLDSYLQLGAQLGKTSLSAQEAQVLYLAANYENDCHYCMAAHSVVAQGVKLPEHIIESLRTGGQLDDQKLDALATFTRKVIQKRGWVEDSDTADFLAAGYTKANILDVILGVAHKTISNYVNHINVTEVDDAFKSQEWKK